MGLPQSGQAVVGPEHDLRLQSASVNSSTPSNPGSPILHHHHHHYYHHHVSSSYTVNNSIASIGHGTGVTLAHTRTHTHREAAASHTTAPTMSQPVTLQMPESLPTSAVFDQLLPTTPAVAPLTEMRDRSPERSHSSGASNQGRAKEPTSTACLACRSKHLKCNGSHPCSRCEASGSECAYVPSRRGYKGPRRPRARDVDRHPVNKPSSHPDRNCAKDTSALEPTSACPARAANSNGVSGSSPDSSSAVTPASSHSRNNGLFYDTSLTELSAYERSPPEAIAIVPTASRSLAERCLDLYYQNFHTSHPFVLPKQFLFLFTAENSIEPLLSAMRWVGSLYLDGPATHSQASFFDEAVTRVRDPGATRDGFLLQAMMVLLVGMDGVSLNDRARELLGEAEKLAVEIAINTRPFSIFHGQGVPVLEESWRRTWWDLFVIDGMIAGVHRTTNFALFDTLTDVGLPCEEHQYRSGNIPQPMYLEDLEEREFTYDDREFSSFAYLILCARNLGKFMRTPPITGPHDDNLARTEALLTNWRLHLPPTKKDIFEENGEVDQMMFQAHMMAYATSILLHQPHSKLDTSPAAAVNSCAPHPARVISNGDPSNAHTHHTTSAASSVSRLVTLRSPLLSHTHFFTCILTLSSIVHLSKWALDFVQYDDDDLRQLLRLNMGALNELAHVWPSAERARKQVRDVAAEIYQAKKQRQAAPQFWFGLTNEQVMGHIAADEALIEEVESAAMA